MSLFVDKKYINFVASHFEKFKWKNEKLANCRCVFCGDSKENKNKMRGYFFAKNNTFFYKCHNCSRCFNVYKVLEQLSPVLCRDYVIESEWLKTGKEEILPKHEKPIFNKPLEIQYISSLPETHKARIYVEKRNIPKEHWENLGYTDDFSKLAVDFNPQYEGRFYKEDRLLILIREENEIVKIQGRSFSKNAKMKYITLKKNDRESYYNMNRLDVNNKFYIVEGPIDSMFLPNAVATLGISGFKSIAKKLDDTNAIYVLDNQPMNKDVIKLMNDLIKKDKKVCIFPKFIKQKDINDMVNDGIDVVDMIGKNTFCGLEAMVKYNEWKKL